jgi:hypothetical protein
MILIQMPYNASYSDGISFAGLRKAFEAQVGTVLTERRMDRLFVTVARHRTDSRRIPRVILRNHFYSVMSKEILKVEVVWYGRIIFPSRFLGFGLVFPYPVHQPIGNWEWRNVRGNGLLVSIRVR